jgi:Ca2+-binding EF-hand superfamily protein
MHHQPIPRWPNRILLAACLSIVAAGAPAQPAAPGPMTFEGFDLNGDGAVTEQEFTDAHAARMSARAAQGMPMRGAASPPVFADFDRDGDGRMTPEEFLAGRQARMQQMGPMGPGMAPGMGPGMDRGMGMPAFSDFDTNGDGNLTSQEFYDARAERMRQRAQQGFPMRNAPYAPTFESLDGDGDSRVSPEEFGAAQARHHQEMMQRMMQPPPAASPR